MDLKGIGGPNFNGVQSTGSLNGGQPKVSTAPATSGTSPFNVGPKVDTFTPKGITDGPSVDFRAMAQAAAERASTIKDPRALPPNDPMSLQASTHLGLSKLF